MNVTRLQLRDFRSYERGELRLGPGLTVVAGQNGAGKTNLLEALYFACTGRSCKTANEREVVRFGAGLTRLVLEAADERGAHEITVGFQPGDAKKLRVDGAAGGQRSALISGPRPGRAGRGPRPAWDGGRARHGIALMRDRLEAVERLR